MISLPLDFVNRMKTILKDESSSFFESLELPSVKAIFVNNNKIDVEKFKKLIDFEILPVPYEKNGFYVETEHLGKHTLHHAGAYYVQEPSAMFTVNALNFNGNEKVLDMCAAPGGKSIQIANRIPNGVLVSNEFVKGRSEILFSNIERMGLKNVIITNDSPKHIADAYSNFFDVCLVDAPCSGEGMFRKGEDMIKSWNANLPNMCAERQLDILEQANKTLKQGGYLIYSTCTYSIEENENVVKEFIKRHNYKLVSIDQGNSNFVRGIDMKETVRLYPHRIKGEGQFVSVMKKLEENNLFPVGNLKLNESKFAARFIKENTNLTGNIVEYKNSSFFVKDLSNLKRNVNYVSIGVKLGVTDKNRFIPHHNLFSAFGSCFKIKLNFGFKDVNVLKYIKGETLDIDLPDGYGVICVENCSLGGFKISKGQFKNLYPKGLREEIKV